LPEATDGATGLSFLLIGLPLFSRNGPSKITGVEKAERTPFSAKKAKHDTRVGVRNTPVIAVEESRRDVAPRNVSTGLSAPQNYRIW
jgi:hypothetical protein